MAAPTAHILAPVRAGHEVGGQQPQERPSRRRPRIILIARGLELRSIQCDDVMQRTPDSRPLPVILRLQLCGLQIAHEHIGARLRPRGRPPLHRGCRARNQSARHDGDAGDPAADFTPLSARHQPFPSIVTLSLSAIRAKTAGFRANPQSFGYSKRPSDGGNVQRSCGRWHREPRRKSGRQCGLQRVGAQWRDHSRELGQ
jgi:hypothetical protein